MAAPRRNWIAWTACGLLALLILAAPAPAASAAPTDRYFRVEATSDRFSPGTLSVNPGDRVTIDLVAKDVVHGLSVDGYAVSVTSDPGQTHRLTFVADRPGVFTFRCSVACGALHPFIVGKLKVGPNWFLLRGLALSALAVIAGFWLAKK